MSSILAAVAGCKPIISSCVPCDSSEADNTNEQYSLSFSMHFPSWLLFGAALSCSTFAAPSPEVEQERGLSITQVCHSSDASNISIRVTAIAGVETPKTKP